MLDVVIWRAVSRFFLCAALPIKQACMRNSSKPKFKRCGTHDGGKHFPSLFLFLDRLLYHGLSHIQGSKKEDNKRNHTRDLLSSLIVNEVWNVELQGLEMLRINSLLPENASSLLCLYSIICLMLFDVCHSLLCCIIFLYSCCTVLSPQPYGSRCQWA